VTFNYPTPGSNLKISWNLSGIDFPVTPWLHAFRIHEFGDLSNDCTSLGGHYNPTGAAEGAHLGDLGDIAVNSSGDASDFTTSDEMNLYGKYNILGRGCVLYYAAGESPNNRR